MNHDLIPNFSKKNNFKVKIIYNLHDKKNTCVNLICNFKLHLNILIWNI